MPDRDRLLNSCAAGERRRLQRRLGHPETVHSWLVQWRKSAGDAVQPNEIVAKLVRDDVIVELVYAQRGTLAEQLVGHGEYAETDKRLGSLERRAKQISAETALLRQYVVRQRADADTIALLQSQLAALQTRLEAAPGTTPDAKFRRLKHEFSKLYHPDTSPAGDRDRLLRERVFQEFWPIVEEIERS